MGGALLGLSYCVSPSYSDDDSSALKLVLQIDRLPVVKPLVGWRRRNGFLS